MFDNTSLEEVFLVDITGEYFNEDGVVDSKKRRGFNKAVAIMSDGSRLEFPDVNLFPDNHLDEGLGKVTQLRLRVVHPLGDNGFPVGPSFLIPQRCSLQYVKNAILRCVKRV